MYFVLFVREKGYEQDALKATIEVNTGYGFTTTLGTAQREPFGIGVLANRTLTALAPAYFCKAKYIDGSLPIHFCIVKAKVTNTQLIFNLYTCL